MQDVIFRLRVIFLFSVNQQTHLLAGIKHQ